MVEHMVEFIILCALPQYVHIEYSKVSVIGSGQMHTNGLWEVFIH